MFSWLEFEKWLLNQIITINMIFVEYFVLSYNLFFPWRRKKALGTLIECNSHMALTPFLFFIINVLISSAISSSDYISRRVVNTIKLFTEKKLINWEICFFEPLLFLLGLIVFTIIIQLASRYFRKTIFNFEHVFNTIFYSSVLYVPFTIIKIIYSKAGIYVIPFKSAIFYYLTNTFNVSWTMIYYINDILFIISDVLLFNFIWAYMAYGMLILYDCGERKATIKTLGTSIAMFSVLQILIGLAPSYDRMNYYNKVMEITREQDSKMQAVDLQSSILDWYFIISNDDKLPSNFRYISLTKSMVWSLGSSQDADTQVVFNECLNKFNQKDYASIELIVKHNFESTLKKDTLTQVRLLQYLENAKVLKTKEDFYYTNKDWIGTNMFYDAAKTLKICP